MNKLLNNLLGMYKQAKLNKNAEEDLFEVGWGLYTNDEYEIKDNALYGDDKPQEVNETFWNKINNEINKVESWFLKEGYKKFFTKVRDEGHGKDSELGGTAWMTENQLKDFMANAEQWDTEFVLAESSGTLDFGNIPVDYNEALSFKLKIYVDDKDLDELGIESKRVSKNKKLSSKTKTMRKRAFRGLSLKRAMHKTAGEFEEMMKLKSTDPKLIKYLAKEFGVEESTVSQYTDVSENAEELYNILEEQANKYGYEWDKFEYDEYGDRIDEDDFRGDTDVLDETMEEIKNKIDKSLFVLDRDLDNELIFNSTPKTTLLGHGYDLNMENENFEIYYTPEEGSSYDVRVEYMSTPITEYSKYSDSYINILVKKIPNKEKIVSEIVNYVNIELPKKIEQAKEKEKQRQQEVIQKLNNMGFSEIFTEIKPSEEYPFMYGVYTKGYKYPYILGKDANDILYKMEKIMMDRKSSKTNRLQKKAVLQVSENGMGYVLPNGQVVYPGDEALLKSEKRTNERMLEKDKKELERLEKIVAEYPDINFDRNPDSVKFQIPRLKKGIEYLELFNETIEEILNAFKENKLPRQATKKQASLKYYAVSESGANFGSNDNKDDLKEEIREYVVAHKDNFEKKEKIYLKESDTNKTIEEIKVNEIVTPYGSKKWVIVATKKTATIKEAEELIRANYQFSYDFDFQVESLRRKDKKNIDEIQIQEDATKAVRWFISEGYKNYFSKIQGCYYTVKEREHIYEGSVWLTKNQLETFVNNSYTIREGQELELITPIYAPVAEDIQFTLKIFVIGNITHYIDIEEKLAKHQNKLSKSATIKHENGVYNVYSESGKCLGKGYKTKEEAEKRLKQVEYFKNKKAATGYDFYGPKKMPETDEGTFRIKYYGGPGKIDYLRKSKNGKYHWVEQTHFDYQDDKPFETKDYELAKKLVDQFGGEIEKKESKQLNNKKKSLRDIVISKMAKSLKDIPDSVKKNILSDLVYVILTGKGSFAYKTVAKKLETIIKDLGYGDKLKANEDGSLPTMEIVELISKEPKAMELAGKFANVTKTF